MVLDASALVAAVCPEEFSEWAAGWVRSPRVVHVLTLTHYEAYNAIWRKAVLLGELTPEEARRAASLIDDMLSGCMIHPFSEVREATMKAALETGLTVYDSAYLALALRVGAPLVTTDDRIRRRLGRELRDLVITPTSASRRSP